MCGRPSSGRRECRGASDRESQVDGNEDRSDSRADDERIACVPAHIRARGLPNICLRPRKTTRTRPHMRPVAPVPPTPFGPRSPPEGHRDDAARRPFAPRAAVSHRRAAGASRKDTGTVCGTNGGARWEPARTGGETGCGGRPALLGRCAGLRKGWREAQCRQTAHRPARLALEVP